MDEKAKTERLVLYMACAVMGIGIAYLFLVTFFTIPESGTEHSKTITGFILGVTISTLISYFWGSSKGSGMKSEAMEKQLNGLIPPTSTTAVSRTVETVDTRKTETVTEPPKTDEIKP